MIEMSCKEARLRARFDFPEAVGPEIMIIFFPLIQLCL